MIGLDYDLTPTSRFAGTGIHPVEGIAFLGSQTGRENRARDKCLAP
jgi:hypothetical protein